MTQMNVLSVEEALEVVASFVKAEAGVGEGKTEYALRCVAKAVSEGVRPEEVCLVVNTREAARAARDRLTALCPKADDVYVTTVQQLACAVLAGELSNAEGARGMGRVCAAGDAESVQGVCVASSLERSFLLTDLRGQHPDIAWSKLLPRVFARWSCASQPCGEVSAEERQAEEALIEHVRQACRLLPEELSMRALQALDACGEVPVVSVGHAAQAGVAVQAGEIPSVPNADCVSAEGDSSTGKSLSASGDELAVQVRGFRLVVADDFQNLSPASQALCEALAGERLVVTGSAEIALPGFDVRTGSAGFRTFEERHADAQVFRLAPRKGTGQRIRAFGQAALKQDSHTYDELVARDEVSPADESVRVLKWRTAKAESEGVGSLVRALLRADATLLPQDVYVAVAREDQACAVQESLRHHRLESTVSLSADPLARDPRAETGAGVLAAWARLNLAVRSDEALAWRIWCGLGKRSLATRTWAAFETWAASQGVCGEAAVDVLLACEGEAFSGADELRAACAEGKKAIERVRGKRGFSLVAACNPQEDRDFARLCGRIEGMEAADELLDRVNANARFQLFDGAASSVRIGSLSHLQGLSPRVVVVVGAVCGLVPRARCFDGELDERRRDALLSQERVAFCSAVGKAQDALVVSLFQKMPADEAHACGVLASRIKPEQGVCMAVARPCPFIADAQNAAPGTQSAEQFLNA